LRPSEGERSDSEEASEEVAGRRLVGLATLVYSAMAAVAVLWRVVIQGEPIFFASVAAQEQGLSFWGDLTVGVGTALLVILLSDLLTQRTQWGEELTRRLAATVGSLSSMQCVGLALLSGIGEEMFFRGALQPAVGLGWASLLFGLMHFAPEKALLPWTGFAVVMGVVFGALYLWTGSLWAPIVAHVVINGVNLPRLVRRHAEFEGRV
jgi:membrane protease YdiL (CAAX protease family)